MLHQLVMTSNQLENLVQMSKWEMTKMRNPWKQKFPDPTRKKIRSRLCAREYKTKKQGKIQRAPPASQLFSAMPPLEAVLVLVSIMMSVSLSNKWQQLKLRHYDISRAHFQGTSQRLIYIRLPASNTVLGSIGA